MTVLSDAGVGDAFAARFPSKSRNARRLKDRVFMVVCVCAATASTLVLVTLLTSVVVKALGLTYTHLPLFKQFLVGLGIFLLFVGGLTTIILGIRIAKGARGRIVPVWLVAAAGLLGSALMLYLLATSGESRNFLTADFITSVPSRNPEQAGIWPAMIGTLCVCAICAFFAIPIGVGTAVLLEEYSPKHPLLRRAHMFVQLNITNLAGVPSIVYGILGLTAFVNLFGLIDRSAGTVPNFGATWYERYQTEGGESLLVRVEDEKVGPPADLSSAAFIREADMKPIAVTIEPEAAFAPRRERAAAVIGAFADAFEAQVDRAESLEVDRIPEMVAEAYRAAPGLMVDQQRIVTAAVARFARADAAVPREVRRARRGLVNDVEAFELHGRFAYVLTDAAAGFRVDKKSPWYIQLPFGRSILAGGLTLMLVILPIIIIASQEALRAVPRSLRQGSMALGSTHWQTTRRITLPSATPGIMTGVILAMSRAIGEAAPLLIIAGIVYITFTPQNLMDQFTVMPLQIFEWARRPQQEFFQLAAAGIILLMSILLCINGLAIYIRHRMNSYQS